MKPMPTDTWKLDDLLQRGITFGLLLLAFGLLAVGLTIYS